MSKFRVDNRPANDTRHHPRLTDVAQAGIDFLEIAMLKAKSKNSGHAEFYSAIFQLMRTLPPLNELRAFDAAARHLSFKEAADELGVTPTAISHQIKLLEDYCGQPLFRRRPRPITLTEAGNNLFAVVRNGLDAISGAFAALREQANHRPLRVTATNA